MTQETACGYTGKILRANLSRGPLKDKKIDRDAMRQALQTYYRMSGWDPELAAPTAEKLHELDVAWAVEELGKLLARR